MTEDQPGRTSPPNLHEQQEGRIEALTKHFAQDRIDAEEFEVRVDRVYRAQSVQELEAITADLPALPESSREPAIRESETPTLAAADEVRKFQVIAALMGGTERKGTWIPARKISVPSVMGGVCLDFREAHFGAGVTEVHALALMGGIEIIVPPDLRVESSGIGIMGGFEGLDQRGTSDDPDQPTLQVQGLALMGGVEISVRRRGETARDAKRRRKEERRRRRRESGG